MPTTVLLTGGTGSLGASTLVQLMADPEINVIAVLRSLSKSEAFLRTKYAAQVSSGRLSFVEISDMTTPNSFDEAASNANAIIHIATPVAYTDLLERMIKPSWPIVHNVLTAAEKSARVKRVIVTGSMVSTMKIPEDLFSGQVITEESWNPIPFEAADANPRNAYQYSKVYAEQKAWDFMKEEPRHFDLIVLLAPSITGKSVQEGFQPEKGNLGGQPGIYRMFDSEKLDSLYPQFMDVEDVARVHILCLSPSVPGNARYLFHSPELLAVNDVARAIRADFPQLRSRIQAPEEGADSGLPPNIVKTDISKFEKIFGTQWKSARQSVKETVEDILAFEATEGK